MNLGKLLKSKKLIDDIASSIKNILYANFPKTTTEEREDIEQEVILKIWQTASNGKKIGNLRSYLWRVVYTTALDVIKERMVHASQDEIISHIDALNISRFELISPESLVEKKELAEIIKNEIHSLSPRRKSVLELHLSGMNIEEIAIFLGWSDNQVRHLLYRGIQDLAEIIKNRMHDSCTRKNDKIK